LTKVDALFLLGPWAGKQDHGADRPDISGSNVSGSSRNDRPLPFPDGFDRGTYPLRRHRHVLPGGDPSSFVMAGGGRAPSTMARDSGVRGDRRRLLLLNLPGKTPEGATIYEEITGHGGGSGDLGSGQTAWPTKVCLYADPTAVAFVERGKLGGRRCPFLSAPVRQARWTKSGAAKPLTSLSRATLGHIRIMFPGGSCPLRPHGTGGQRAGVVNRRSEKGPKEGTSSSRPAFGSERRRMARTRSASFTKSD